MPWICKNNRCHINNPDEFEIRIDESRTDTIAHRFAATDEERANELGDPKIYVGEDSRWSSPYCSCCESVVYWAESHEAEYRVSGKGCPACGPEGNAEGGSFNVTKTFARQEMACTECGATWTDEYALKDVWQLRSAEEEA
tara:strand:- start:930 stop:1352 length:423 start_codon:yes stop_codon:yes gene_type:complete